MPTLADVTLWPEELEFFRPPTQLTVSEWADEHRRLDSENNSVPGRWRTDFTPYLRGIQDAYGDPRCREIVLMGSTQWGKTESEVNMLLWTIAEDPVPTLFVLPTEELVKSFGARRLRVAIENCKPTNALRTGRKVDWTSHELALGGMVLYLAWANSASRLAMRSIGRLFMDEVDKYPPFAGREADPISLATERLRWWKAQSKRVLSSTPTLESGYIWQAWLESDRRWYHVPCPFCATFQPLRFGRDTVRWPDEERDPVRIAEHRLAWYVCVKCQRPIPDDGTHKTRMLADGVWVPDGGRVDRKGRVVGARLDGPTRGFHVNALYSPMLTWSEVAAEFLRSRVEIGRQMNFQNSWLGWPWVEKSAETDVEKLKQRVIELPRGVVPGDAICLTAGVDVQKHGLYYVVRATSPGGRTHVVEYGIVDDFDRLELAVLARTFPVAGDASRNEQVRLACIDSGYRTDEVYQFCLERSDRCRPVKGFQSRAVPVSTFKIERSWSGQAGGLLLWALDTGFFKSKLHRKFQKLLGRSDSWSVHHDPAEEFLEHLTSEHLVLVRKKRSQQVSEEWRRKAHGGPNHWLDCEVYAEAADQMLGLYAIQDPETLERIRAASAPPRRAETDDEPKERRGRGPGRRGGWIRRRR